MSTAGTIDRPATHDPKKQDPTMSTTDEPQLAHPLSNTTNAPETCQNRTREMQLIPEALARAHMHERLNEAESQRKAVRLATARRMQRRAERASMRARRALAMAVMS
ncbi:hypothetical protein AAHZ94_32255 [Streptomyces sp. HSW2009]|uniref:hypothetical protein n=1 Tax=Streptomyces sp. HSW2009 TaxID=3142890 RepID=UPI0032EFDEC8